MRTAVVHVRVPPELHARLSALAEVERRSIARMVEIAIEEAAERRGR